MWPTQLAVQVANLLFNELLGADAGIVAMAVGPQTQADDAPVLITMNGDPVNYPGIVGYSCVHSKFGVTQGRY